MSEHKLQNEIRNALAGGCLAFRANVGQAWAGEAVKLPSGDVLVKNARVFSTGLPPGFSDVFGMVPVTITPDMVGKQIGLFFALEVKAPKGKVSDKQTNFLNAVKNYGGRAGVARSTDDALKIIRGEYEIE